MTRPLRCRWLLGLAVLLAGGCAMSPTITTDYVTGTDFSRYRTFGLMRRLQEPMPIGGPAVLAGVRAAVDEAMTARGYDGASEKDADLLVRIHGRVNPRITVGEYGYEMPAHSWRHGYFSDQGDRFSGRETTSMNVGQLTIDVVDRRTQELLWRGIATKEGVPDVPDPRRLSAVVKRVLRQFPAAHSSRP